MSEYKYDIFGDVHGHYHLLKKALRGLGYKKIDGVYQHPRRKAIFVGDILNRGPQVGKTVKHVRRMVRAQKAYMVLGNHEYAYLAYFQRGQDGKYLLPHTAKNRSRLEATLRDFNTRKKRQKLFKWLLTIPLYLELDDDLRVVHACWQEDSIGYIKRKFPRGRMTPRLLQKAAQVGTKHNRAVMMTIDGPKLRKTSKRSYDFQIHRRGSDLIKMKWWVPPKEKTVRSLALNSRRKAGSHPTPKKYRKGIEPYPTDAPHLFIGHYCLSSTPEVQSDNVCCLDYGVLDYGRLAVYSWKPKKRLKNKHLKVYSL